MLKDDGEEAIRPPSSKINGLRAVADDETVMILGQAPNSSLESDKSGLNLEDVDVEQIQDEKFVPRFCFWRSLAVFTCFFKVHGGAGKIPALTDGQWATLFACCLCGFLNAYDWELWPLALTQFQNDLNVSETDIGLIGSAIRTGNALSFPISALGDWYGRKFVRFVSLPHTAIILTS
jgi:hypothetical protein